MNANEERPLLETDTTSLAILLIVFLGLALASVLSILLDRADLDRAAEAALPPRGPADYADILDQDFTAGLDPAAAAAAEFPVPRPPFSDGVFPCSECHESLPPDPTVRAMDLDHTGIVLKHGGEERWCLDCHDLNDRDQLRLAGGRLVPFTESYRLCGQCHGDKYRDWRLGIHGRRTGFWNGPRRYLLCAHCHDPHAPKFAHLVPLAPPARPMVPRERR